MKAGSKTQRKKIEKDQIRQLEAMGLSNEFYGDIVSDYMRMWDIKNKLLDDIEERGVTVEYQHGGGQSGVKQNESVQNLLKVSDRMGKLLTTLGIKPDTVTNPDEDEEIDL